MTPLCDQATAVRALVESADPGAVWAVGGPEGPRAGSDGEHPADAAFDVDGLSAVLALWPVIGSLVDEGALRLHTPLAAYGDAAAEGTPAGTTAHHLLTHPAGTAALVHLTRLVEHLSGSPLADLAAARIWHPLGMTGTRFADGTLHAPLVDLVRFLCRLLDPGDPAGPPGISRAWTTESLRIRTGELTPARGLLWDPAPHGVWTHHAPGPGGPALWISPRHHRWAVLLPTAGRPAPHTAFREAAFAPTTPE
ncbi:serine hydrolase [Streptomyces spororaveus]|uniref:serine hydrolase n=1 Tax=Streptomyces spororaveus TaxID=284039 RepID=UPI00207AB3FB|nr:serine hydrolase [Streptomyces spororaveus]MCM9076860.1 serine hydrolase [Streptomyces spororaveus]